MENILEKIFKKHCQGFESLKKTKENSFECVINIKNYNFVGAGCISSEIYEKTNLNVSVYFIEFENNRLKISFQLSK